MIAAVQAGSADYDIVVPFSFDIADVRRDGLLCPLDKDKQS